MIISHRGILHLIFLAGMSATMVLPVAGQTPPEPLPERIQRLKTQIDIDEKRITDIASNAEVSAEELTPIVTKAYELRRELFELQCEQLRQRADDIQATVDRRHRHASLIIERRVRDLLKSNRQVARGDSIPPPVFETPKLKKNTENHAVSPTAKPRPKQHQGIALRFDCPTSLRTGQEFLATIVLTNKTGETIEGVRLTVDFPPQFNVIGPRTSAVGSHLQIMHHVVKGTTQVTLDRLPELTPGERKAIDLKLIRLFATEPAVIYAIANHKILQAPVTASKSFGATGNAFPNWQPQPKSIRPAPDALFDGMWQLVLIRGAGAQYGTSRMVESDSSMMIRISEEQLTFVTTGSKHPFRVDRSRSPWVREFPKANGQEMIRQIVSFDDGILRIGQRWENVDVAPESFQDRDMYTVSYRRLPGPFGNLSLEAVKAFEEGNAYFYEQEFDAAIKCFDRAIELESKFAQAFRKRATTFLQLEQVGAAIDDFEKSIAIDPSNAKTQSDYAILLVRSLDGSIRNTEKAVQLIENVCRLERNNFAHHATAAKVYAAHGDVAKARLSLQRARKLNKTEELAQWAFFLEAELRNYERRNTGSDVITSAVQKSYSAIPADPKQAKYLDILKGTDVLLTSGESYDYKLIVFNRGNKVIKDITVQEVLTQDEVLAANPQADFDRKSKKLTWIIEALSPGEQRVFIIRKPVRKPAGNWGKPVAAGEVLKKDGAATEKGVDN